MRHCFQIASHVLVLSFVLAGQSMTSKAFEVQRRPEIGYEKYNPFNDGVKKCTETRYKQQDDGNYAGERLWWTGVKFDQQSNAFLMDEVEAPLGAPLVPKRKVSYYRIQGNDKFVSLLELNENLSGNEGADYEVKVWLHVIADKVIVDLVPESNYLNVLVSMDSREEMLAEIQAIRKSFDRIEPKVSLRPQPSRKGEQLKPGKIRFLVDMDDMREAVRQMVNLSDAGVRAAERIKRAVRIIRSCE